jgi:hypothetical protein
MILTSVPLRMTLPPFPEEQIFQTLDRQILSLQQFQKRDHGS